MLSTRTSGCFRLDVLQLMDVSSGAGIATVDIPNTKMVYRGKGSARMPGHLYVIRWLSRSTDCSSSELAGYKE